MRRENKVYKITVSDRNFSVPPVCTCCMKPATELEPVMCFGRNREALMAKMPICSECVEHRGKGKFYKPLISALSVVVGILVFVALMIAKIGFPVLLSTASVPIAFFILAFLIPVKALSEEHSSRERSVSIASAGVNVMYPTEEERNTITFTFTNRRFAELFKATNAHIAGDIVEVDSPNSANKQRAFSMCKDILKTVFLLTVVFFFVANMINKKVIEEEIESRPLTEYSAASQLYDKIYTDIVWIYPEYTVVSTYNNMPMSVAGLVCKCETTDGSKLWAYVDIEDYEKYFDHDIKYIDQTLVMADPAYFGDNPITMYGTVEKPDSIDSDLKSKIDSKTLVKLTSVN